MQAMYRTQIQLKVGPVIRNYLNCKQGKLYTFEELEIIFIRNYLNCNQRKLYTFEELEIILCLYLT